MIKKTLFIILLAMTCHLKFQAQAVYVDSNTGDDKNIGTKESPVYSINKAAEIIRSRSNNIYTMKINPGIYVLDSHIKVATEKEMSDKRIVIEASILPGDTAWTPEKMPVITCKALKGEIPISRHWVVSLLIDESRVTIRGIKFSGYFYPHTRYFPIARINKSKTDLLVQQCMFIGDANISQIQSGIIAYDNEIKVDHCVFYKIRNGGVFFQDSGNGIKRGASITNTIFYGVSQAVWFGSPEKEFIFENNIVSNCRYVFVKRNSNTTKYSINNCIIVNNKYYKGIPDSVRLTPGEFEINENNIIKKGDISLRLSGEDDMPALLSVDEPLSMDYMHIIPGSLGYDMKAGLFKK